MRHGQMRAGAGWAALAGVCGAAGVALGQASIQFVPALPGGDAFSVAYAATPDGRYVVGYSGAAQGPEAYRWNRETGQQDALGYLANMDWFRSRAYGISDDGSVVVGSSDTGDHSVPHPAAFKWTPQSGMAALPTASTTHQLGPQGHSAIGVSADGTVIVGRFESTATLNGVSFYPALMHEWCLWTPAGVQLFPASGAANPGFITAVSADGAAIAGYVGDALQGTLVLDRTVGTATALGSLTGGGKVIPAAISRDKGTVIGWATQRDGDGVVRYHAFRWRQAGGMTDLGGLPGIIGLSQAKAVSGDGSVIVGTQQGHALIWDAMGVHDLSTVLSSQGVSLQGKVLRDAVWVSPDGAWVVGNADGAAGAASGWIARVR